MAWDKDNIVGKIKPAQTRNTNFKIAITASYKLASVQPSPGTQGSILLNSYLGGQMP